MPNLSIDIEIANVDPNLDADMIAAAIQILVEDLTNTPAQTNIFEDDYVNPIEILKKIGIRGKEKIYGE